MIASIRIANFKSYRDAELPLAPLTLLIGANASGKSNAIEAIRLLALLAEGRRLDDILSLIQSSDEVIRGSARDLARNTDEAVRVGCELETEDWNRLEIAFRLGKTWPWIEDERVTNRDGEMMYHFRCEGEGRRDASVWYKDFGASAGVPPFIPAFNQQAIFLQLESPARFDRHSNAFRIIPRTVARFRTELERIRFFDPQPKSMRGYSNSGERNLREDGSNISSVLFDLCKTEQRKHELLQFVAELPEQPFVGISFIRTTRDDVMVQLEESYGHSRNTRDAPVLSDGTLRVLAIAAALLSAEPGSTLVVEEIDQGVHPSRAEYLLANILRVAEERKLRVLLTTHNPALLDRLPIHAIPHVVCCYRDPEEGDSRLVRLEELPSYPELLARGPLGQLMTRGVLDYFLKHQRSEEEKQAESRRWLDGLRAQVGDA